MKLRSLSVWKLIVSGFGLGYSPYAPGTMGALGALPPAILILKYAQSPYIWLVTLILIFTVLGIIGSNKLRYDWGRDPSRIVVDEMVGMWISLMWVGTGWIPLFAAFILFRFFDIAKPLGIGYTERLPRGLGVMTDDILAGIYTNAILQIALMLIPAFV
jgi:phosphatidylglycerophosphatase A